MRLSLCAAVVAGVMFILAVANGAEAVIDRQLRQFLSERADFNADGFVNGSDMARILVLWGQPCAGCPEDLNRDGYVTAADLTLLLMAWTGEDARISLPHSSGDMNRRTVPIENVVNLHTSPFNPNWTRVWVAREGRMALEGYDVEMRFEDVLTVLWLRQWEPQDTHEIIICDFNG